MKQSFVFYADWWEMINALPTDAGNNLLRAICEYAFNGALPTDPMTVGMIAFIKMKLDENAQKWGEVREKRREAGLKSAAARCTKSQQVLTSANADNKSQQVPTPTTVYVDVNVDDNVDVDNLTFSNEKVECDLGAAKSPTICQRLSKILGKHHTARAKYLANIWNTETAHELAGIVPPYGTKPQAKKRRAAIDEVLLSIAEAAPGTNGWAVFEQYAKFAEWVTQCVIRGELEAPSSRAPFDKYMTAEYVAQWTASRNDHGGDNNSGEAV